MSHRESLLPVSKQSSNGSSRLSNRKSLVENFNNLSVNNSERNSLKKLISNERQSFIGRRSSNVRHSMVRQQQPFKDPRPIREKQWLVHAIKTLINFLVGAGYTNPVSQKTLQAPSAKDFQSIFKFLYAQLDPYFEYDKDKKFEEEVPMILKALRYPFAEQISKSHLYSVGSMHAWPSLLAVLTWMVELILCCENLDQVDSYEEDAQAEKIFYDYLTKTYTMFLINENNDYHEMVEELKGNFDKKNEQILKAVEKLENTNKNLEKQLTELTLSEDPLIALQRAQETLTSDKEKFQQYLSYIEGRKIKALEITNTLNEEVLTKETELEKVLNEKNSLQQVVDSQEISPADVDRMNAERDQLQSTLIQLSNKQEEVNKRVWEKEIEIQKEMDKLDKLIKAFNDSSFQLGLSDPSADGDGKIYELILNFHASKTDEMLNLDLKNVVKPTLMALRSKNKESIHRIEDLNIQLQEEIEKLIEEISEKKEELKEMQQNIIKFNLQYTEQKDIMGNAISNSNKEKERLEGAIQKLKLEINSKLVQSHQKVKEMEIEQDQVQRKCHERSENNKKIIYKVLEDYIQYSSHVSECLTELDSIVLKEYVDAGGELPVN
ncbi:kinetochore-associated Ndc80 complex subunit ndc80 [Lobulomyces angularis]|nr:kinetochore-associated Ndc80 complex subunit ndc80 [Lobulomyces angularis]